ncbi:MAG TPA: AAA family ATPase [Solirubrobacteraceae bacterium]|jgi:DNA-binding CsgD family transcriptional regulator
MSTAVSVGRLLGRRSECAVLDELVVSVRSGLSRALVVRGEAGVGKSALLEYLVGRASGCGIGRTGGVESEMELAFAGLQQLCAPFLGRLGRLPGPQRDALGTAFGLRGGASPDRFLVGLAVLALLSEVAEERPLVCVVDDAQWLDMASAQALAFVARRLGAESVGLVVAVREPFGERYFDGLLELAVGGLDYDEARELLATVMPGPLDERVRDRIVAETRGNPLALLELPSGRTPAELAGGFGLSDAPALAGRIEQSFRERLAALPPSTRLLLLIAAAEPVGDPVLLWRAAERLEVAPTAAAAADAHGLLTIGERVTFRHPLVRSAVYGAAEAEGRQRVHRALADATDADADPDRRAWHLAHATVGLDEDVAAELERSAGRAQDRGGLAAAAAFLQRALVLTQDPALRAGRALAAAEASLEAGAFDAALGLLATASAGPLDESQRARVVLLRGRAAFAAGPTRDAPGLLLEAARRLEPFDMELARESYLTALGAAIFAGHYAEGNVLLEICRAVRALPPPAGPPRPLDLLLEGLALLISDGHASATPTLRRAAKALLTIPAEDVLRWGWITTGAWFALWDEEGLRATAERNLRLVRDAGALSELPVYLSALGEASAWMGDFAGAASLITEAESVAAATGSRFPPFTALRLRALQGREAEASELIAAVIELSEAMGQGHAATTAHWETAVLYNGLARYQEASSAARQATAKPIEPWVSVRALVELVEAAARGGNPDIASDALKRLAETTQPSGTDFALGVEARCRALVSHGETAERLYREAIERLGRTKLRPELARAHLLYGEWLRREHRRLDARTQLRLAHSMLADIGMEAFAERARRELLATGETARKRTVETLDELTPQEQQVARLAADGQTNREIAAQLFLSPRTVEWHLSKVFGKLGIGSRKELPAALSDAGAAVAPP